jgi:hypothetical protein
MSRTPAAKATAEHQAQAWRAMAAHGHRFGTNNLAQALAHPLARRVVHMLATAIAQGHQPYGKASPHTHRASNSSHTAATCGKAAACGSN